jgi:anti-anti-sigma regulatory factor
MGSVLVNTTGTGDLTTTVRATGNLDEDTAGRLRRALVRMIMRGGPGRLVVDLGRVTGLDPLAIGVLQAALATAQDVHRTLVFHTCGSPLAEHLRRHGILDSRVPG